MQVKAFLNDLRMAPRKLRLVADLIRGKRATQARSVLSFSTRAASRPFAKILNSALSNAKNNFQIEEENLYLKEVLVDEGPKLKRWRPRSRGRAFPIQKKTSHLTVVLETIEETGAKKKRKAAKKIESVAPPAQTVSLKPEAKAEKPKLKPVIEAPKPKQAGGFQRIFRRKSI